MRYLPTLATLALGLTPFALHAQTGNSSHKLREILPVGSSLSNIEIPRYDKDYRLISHMKAKRVNFLADDKLKGTDVTVEVYTEGIKQSETNLNSAFYFEKQGIIHSTHNLTIFGEQFDIAAQGLITNWNKRSGFLLGKTETLFYLEDNKETNSTDDNNEVNSTENNKEMHSTEDNSTQSLSTTPVKKTTSIKKTAQKVAIIGTSIPALLTAEEIQEIDTLAQPSDAIVSQVDESTLKEEQELNQDIEQLNKQRSDLSTELVTIVANDTEVQETAKPLTPRKEATPVSVEAEDGMYFDSVTGTAIYQKNIVVIHPQVHLTCTDELKVFLKEVPQDPSKAKEQGSKPEFDGLDKAIATGNVVIRAKDSEGKPIITHSEIATYDGDTEIIILKGGRPTVQQGDTIARILSDSGYIKILPNMSVRIVGKHEIEANLNELQD